MRIYENLIPKVSRDFIKVSVNNGYLLIEKHHIRAAQKDIESIFRAYLTRLKDIYLMAKERIEKADGFDRTALNKIRNQIAAAEKFPLEKHNDSYFVKQLLALLFESDNIDDVMVSDAKLEELFLTTCKKNFITDEQMRKEVDKRLFYLPEFYPDIKPKTKQYRDKVREIRRKLEIAKGLRTYS